MGGQDVSENSPQKQAKKNFSYEEAVEMQKQEGGPRRFYGDDELDIESARVTDENGNPIVREADASKHSHGVDTGRSYVHVNVAYCIS